MITCIIIEDEPLATQKLTGFIEQVPFLQLAACFDNGLPALDYLQSHATDLIFLDIQMKHLNGLQFLNALTDKPKVIITSAYSVYAIEGFEHSVSDFLLKPFGFERFLKAVNKAASERSFSNCMPNGVNSTSGGSTLNSAENTLKESDILFVKTEYRMEKICLRDILYIEGMKDYLCIVTDKGRIMTLLSFSKILERLPANAFVRVHKSWIVPLERIEHIERNRIRIGNHLIPISETFRSSFFSLLKKNGFLAE